jgi:hypothetical protein
MNKSAMHTEPPEADPPKRNRRWFQFSLRSLMIVVAVVAVPCAWLGHKIEQKRRQRDAIEAIRRIGGRVEFGYQLDSNGAQLAGDRQPPGALWLRKLLGDDFFADVKSVDLSGTEVRDDDLQDLDELPDLEFLELNGTRITDAGLVHVDGLRRLRMLGLTSSAISDGGLSHLRGLTRLEMLFIAYNPITDAGIEKLTCLKALGWLSVGDTEVTDEGVRQFKRAVPGCGVGP